MEIIIGIGLDNLLFGMSQEEVRNILGTPDKINDEDIAIVYYFNDLLIKTKFDKDEDLRLYSVEVHNPEVLMFNRKIINSPNSEIIKILESNGFKNIEYEDYETFDTIFCEEIWCTFRFEFDRLSDIEFSPLFKDDDTIVWPIRFNSTLARFLHKKYKTRDGP